MTNLGNHVFWIAGIAGASLVGCGGSDSSSSDGGSLSDAGSRTSEGGGGGSSDGSSDGSTRADGTSPGDATSTTDGGGSGTIIFAQPSYPGFAGYFWAPLCTTGIGAGKIPTADAYVFGIRSWQCPLQTGFVANGMSALTETGFNPNGGTSLTTYQAAYANTKAASLAQIDGAQVGVYMDSDDLAGYTTCPSPSDPTTPNVGCKMMMTPEVEFPVGKYMPFKGGGSVVASFELEILVGETTTGSEAYAVSDLLFQDASGAVDESLKPPGPYQFSFGEVIFNNGNAPAACNTNVDGVTGNIEVDCPMLADKAYSTNFTLLSGSFQTSTWNMMMPFKYQIFASQFQTALNTAKMQMPSATFSTDPADYALVEWHANFELNKYEKGRSRLGYSMQSITIALE
jgi:hypothetical protein